MKFKKVGNVHEVCRIFKSRELKWIDLLYYSLLKDTCPDRACLKKEDEWS